SLKLEETNWAFVLTFVLMSSAAATGCGSRKAALASAPNEIASTNGFRARPLTNITFERTPARLERGRYLVEGPLGCFVCHGERDWNALGAPPLADPKGSGRVLEGVMINGVAAGGRRVPPNITPDPETGAGNWTDDMFARAIREGIGHDGRALAVMPWRRFRNLSDEDLASVISYVRSIPAIRNVLPERILTEEQSQRLNPEPLSQPVPEPDLSTPAKRGQYLVTLAGCAGCP